MARCEYCGKPITTEEFEKNDGLCDKDAENAFDTVED